MPGTLLSLVLLDVIWPPSSWWVAGDSALLSWSV